MLIYHRINRWIGQIGWSCRIFRGRIVNFCTKFRGWSRITLSKTETSGKSIRHCRKTRLLLVRKQRAAAQGSPSDWCCRHNRSGRYIPRSFGCGCGCEGMDTRAAVKFSNIVAAIKCTKLGGREGIPTRSAVNKHAKWIIEGLVWLITNKINY